MPPTGTGAGRRLRVHQLAQFAPGGKHHVIDLGKIVVFAGQPEDGHMRAAGRRCLSRPRHRGSRLERSKQRPAEQPHLLPGHHRSRALAQRLQRRSPADAGEGSAPPAAAPTPASAPEQRAEPASPRPAAETHRTPRARSARAIVQKQPVQPRRHGDGIAVCGQQGSLMVSVLTPRNPCRPLLRSEPGGTGRISIGLS